VRGSPVTYAGWDVRSVETTAQDSRWREKKAEQRDLCGKKKQVLEFFKETPPELHSRGAFRCRKKQGGGVRARGEGKWRFEGQPRFDCFAQTS